MNIGKINIAKLLIKTLILYQNLIVIDAENLKIKQSSLLQTNLYQETSFMELGRYFNSNDKPIILS